MQDRMLSQPDVEEVADVVVLRVWNEQQQPCETFFAIAVGLLTEGLVQLAWFLDRKKFALVQAGTDECEPSQRCAMLQYTDVHLSVALLDGNPFDDKGAELGTVWRSGFTMESAGIHPQRGIHAAPIPEKLPHAREQGTGV